MNMMIEVCDVKFQIFNFQPLMRATPKTWTIAYEIVNVTPLEKHVWLSIIICSFVLLRL